MFDVAARTVIAILFITGIGCRVEKVPIFTPPSEPIVWPPPPLTPRIRYVGQLRSAADLKPPPKPFEAIGRLFLGDSADQLLYGPRSVVRAPGSSILWVTDPGGRCIHMMDLASRQYRKVRKLGGRTLVNPVDVAIGPENSVYVCDSQDVAIYRLAADSGKLLGVLKLPEELLRPAAMAYDPNHDELWVVDVVGHDIKVLARDGSLLRIVGRRGNAPGQFNFPTDITRVDDIFWVVDSGNHRIQELDRFGQPRETFGRAGDATGDFALPKGIAVDKHGNIYVVDGRFENVQVFDQTGRLLLVFGEEGTAPGRFWLPAGVFVDEDDRIWVCDVYNRRIQVFQLISPEPQGEP